MQDVSDYVYDNNEIGERTLTPDKQYKSSLDITKLIMAILVIGIHTQPFSFNVWLDRGFGIITRTCVPFFFVASSYLFWRKENNNAYRYIKRLFILYAVWSLVYLPIDLTFLKTMTFSSIIKYYLWIGNSHELWYLLASIIGFIIVYFLLKICRPTIVLLVSVIALVLGCLISTWSPLINETINVRIIADSLGYRNALFYAFPYLSLGMILAKSKLIWKRSVKFLFFGLIISLILLLVESYLFIIVLHTEYTVLWISVFPLSCFLFVLINRIPLSISKSTSVLFRNMSTLIYVSQSLFVSLFIQVDNTSIRFVIVSVCASVFAFLVVMLSKTKWFRFLKWLF